MDFPPLFLFPAFLSRDCSHRSEARVTIHGRTWSLAPALAACPPLDGF